ncbi:MAG: IucA/IucC family protein [Actinomycetota bacterium]|nr:IucA/IucC family protein [Actinomycetota bacterium]
MNLNREERRILRFLKEQVPELAASFVSFVPEGRRAILNRLSTSMLWEDVAGLASESYELEVHDSEQARDATAGDTDRRRVADSLRAFGPQSGATYKVVPLPGREHLIIPITRSHAFGRFEVEGAILHVRRRGTTILRHAVELLRIVRAREMRRTNEAQRPWARFAEELSNGSANLALAYAYHEKDKERLRRLASAHGAATMLELVEALKARDENYNSSLFFERLCVEGHHIHPGAKTKIGMEPAAVYRYAPELEGTPELRFVGIRRDHAEWATLGDKSTNTILFEEYPELREAVDKQFVAGSGLSPDDYVFAPVHSWQQERILPRVYADELAQGIVVAVRGVAISSRATTSFRTVIPGAGERSRRLAVKTAVESQMTSTTRSISSNTAQNGSEFSRLILEVMRREPELAETFVPVCETAGVSFKVDPAERDAELRTLKSRNLSVVLRENVEPFVRPGELAIVGSSLYSASPLTGKPVLAELVERYAEATGEASMRKAALGFVSEYADVALPGYLIMMVKYGIGLEGHLQNVVPVFEHGCPVRMLFRDWGGIRVNVERLERQGLSAKIRPGSVTVAKGVEEMRNKVFYTVFQNHLAEILLQVCKHFEVSERDLWHKIYEASNTVMERLASDREHAEDAFRDREALFRAEMRHKALTRMRLSRDAGDLYVSVPNPLHRSGGLR